MLLCPQCRAALSDTQDCASCHWQGETNGRVRVMLSAADRDSALFKGYQGNYDRIAADDLASEILDLRYVGHQAANLVSVLGRRLRGARVCEVGVGQGYLARAMLKAGAASVTAVDIALPYLETLDHDRLVPVLANAENLPFQDEFDILTATDVAEHVLNLGSFLYCANKALRPSGLLVLRVPLVESLLKYSPFLGCRYRFVHLRSFSEDIIHRELPEAGFDIETFRRDGFWLSTPQPFWMAGARRRQIYQRFKDHFSRTLASPVDVTRWPAWIAALWMRPQELVVRARKVKEL
ncbi:MAG TPA: class I SAM-dependent methyltransferase [Magnetospirillum sp.]|nr:class I SAM-dependent methyltransferase [Magnetospirillum sp.]